MGKWLSNETIALARSDIIGPGLEEVTSESDWMGDFGVNKSGDFGLNKSLDIFGIHMNSCLDLGFFPNLYSIPPMPVMAIALGVCLHAPCSFIYHWCFSSHLDSVSSMYHWSRRLDQSFIHVMIAFLSYGVTGRWSNFWLNVIFNADCIYRQFEKKVSLE